MSNYVYMVRCSDNTLYTGWTTNLKRRVKEHNNESGAKYTMGRTPVRLVYYEKHETRSRALKREYEIKNFSKFKKENMIKNFQKI